MSGHANWEAYYRELESDALLKQGDALLKRQIIEAGIRAMAGVLHPDTGGSHEAMLGLNRCADDLRRAFPKPEPVRKKRKMSKATELKHFLRREQPHKRRQRQRMQSDSWGCWVGDGTAEEWITPDGQLDHYAFYRMPHWPVDLGFPESVKG
jgi:hypothetical protein